MAEKKKTKVVTKRTAPKFDKADLLVASGFTKLDVDILKIALKDNQQYSLDQAKNEIKKFKEAI